ncbi:MAG: hypothetical protein GY809_32410 [Planctomycetes bacterium]|nr:hypothetical protein [Planctomycetota bacterium]
MARPKSITWGTALFPRMEILVRILHYVVPLELELISNHDGIQQSPVFTIANFQCVRTRSQRKLNGDAAVLIIVDVISVPGVVVPISMMSPLQ